MASKEEARRQVVNRYKLEPPTDTEQEWMDRIDATDYAIYSNKMELVCAEAKDAMVNMGISELLQAGDCIVGIYTAQGDLACGVSGTFIHAITGQLPIKYILARYQDEPTVGIRDGDIFLANDAWFGGIHNPDFINAVPIFHGDRLVAWAAAADHQPETGSTNPGGVDYGAKTRFDEGFTALPFKIGENFTIRADISDMMANFVRFERMDLVDRKARTAACMKIREGVLSVVEKKGAGFVAGLLRKMAQAAADGARAKISQLNDGTYRAMMFADCIGLAEGLLRFPIAVTKRGSSLTIDLTGTSPQVPNASFNSMLAGLRAHLAAVLCMYIFSDLPLSSGVIDAVDIIAPEGSCVNAGRDAAVSCNVMFLPVPSNGLHICMSKLLYDSLFRDQVCAPFGSGCRTVLHGGVNQYGIGVAGALSCSMNSTGGGARPDMDGVDAAGFWWSGYSDSQDIEHEESQYAFLYMFRSFPLDQGGFGRQRGGTGADTSIMINGTNYYYVGGAGISHRFASSPGLFGGYYGGVAPYLAVTGTTWKEKFSQGVDELPRNFHDLATKPGLAGTHEMLPSAPGRLYMDGDCIAMVATSGGGYGDVLERDPRAVVEDFQRGIISQECAQDIFKVIFDPETLRIDRAATEEARQAEREARKQRGLRWDEFNEQWLRMRPDPEAIHYYGEYPGPVAV